MSQDLFAAFEDTPRGPLTQQEDHGRAKRVAGNHIDATFVEKPFPPQLRSSTVLADDFGDDDWGDFEDASAPRSTINSLSQRDNTAARTPVYKRPSFPLEPFPPKAQQREDLPPAEPDSKIGKHPFAGHMDFLFDAGEDEYDAGADDLDNLANNPEAAMAYSKRIIAEQEARANLQPQSINGQSQWSHDKHREIFTPSGSAIVHTKPQVRSQPKVPSTDDSLSTSRSVQERSGHASAKDANVLFDADNLSESEDDGWGDFEGETSRPANNGTLASKTQNRQSATVLDVDLLGLDNILSSSSDPEKSLGSPETRVSAAFDASAGVQGRSDPLWLDEVLSHSKPTTANAGTGAMEVNNSWGDFDDFEITEPVSTAVQLSNAPESSRSAPIQKVQLGPGRSTTVAKQESALPPTNVPPPVILLSIFPSLLSSAQDDLFSPLSRLDTARRQQLLSHLATHQFLRKYLSQAIVLAHLIAGRKLRWKRDQILSQSMRIGPAAAGGKGGMKLTGIDKSEVAKEDREVLDVIRLWKAQSGKLRGAITGTKLPAVPDISEQMPVKTLKAVEGGFVAPHACALCGLRREERVAKVDIDIDDSFGEWWVDGMDMHLTCKDWWEENKKRLHAR